MITFEFTQGYPTFVAVLFLLTGGLLLWVDAKAYDTKNMVREKEWAQVLGWMNISMGVLMFLTSWVYLQFLW